MEGMELRFADSARCFTHVMAGGGNAEAAEWWRSGGAVDAIFVWVSGRHTRKRAFIYLSIYMLVGKFLCTIHSFKGIMI